MRNSLRKLEGIHSIEVDLELEEAYVRYAPGIVDVQALIKASTDIGFPASVKPAENAPGADS